jgi:membrane protein
VDSVPILLKRKLWPPQEPKNEVLQWFLVAARYVFAIGRDLWTGELSMRAMSLVYTTMLAIVPALGFAFAVAKSLGLHEDLEPLLLRALEPLGPNAEQVTQRITGFVDNVSGAVLGTVSIGILLLTVISMAQKIESSFNFVWRVDRPRSFGRRFSEYLSAILMGPIVLIVALALITSLSSVTIVERLRDIEPIGTWLAGIGALFPYLMTAVSFALLNLLIPNTKVELKPAAIGGLVGGVVWTATGYLFARLVATSARYLELYSGFAIVLILMFWLYLSWLILLLASQLAYYVQFPFRLRYGLRTRLIDNDTRERLSLSIMYLIASDYAKPSHGWTHESLASKLRVPRDALESILAGLTGAGLVVKTSGERLMPGRDPHGIALKEILATVRGSGRDPAESRERWNASVDGIVDRISDAIEAELGNRTLGQLVDAQIESE